MVEGKGEQMIDSQNVKNKKDAAELMGIASDNDYEVIAGKSVNSESYNQDFLNEFRF